MLKNIIKISLVATMAIVGANANELKRTTQVSSDELDSQSSYVIGDSKIYFMGSDSTHGSEPWVSDGTKSGTYMIGDFNEGTANSSFTLLGAIGDRLLLRNSSDLMKSDGTQSSTKYIKDIDVDTNETRKVTFYNYSDSIKKVGNTLFFTRTNVDNLGYELWKTNGETTSLVKDIKVGESGSYPRSFTEVNGKLIFIADDGVHGTELWSSDGTKSGTIMLKDIYEGSSYPSIYYMGVYNDELYYYTSYSKYVDGKSKYYNQLFKTDGTIAGTKVVFESLDEDRRVSINTDKNSFRVTKDGKIFFMASYYAYDELSETWKSSSEELWFGDGTTKGTKMVKDFNPGTAGSNFSYFHTIGEKIIFTNNDDSSYHLWVSDGTQSGTHELTDIDGNSLYKYYYSYYEYVSPEVNGKIFFYSKLENNDVYGYELYVTDGTSEGTNKVKDISPGSSSSNPQKFFVFNNKVYFMATTPNYGQELWTSDGTTTGTQMVHDMYYGSDYSYDLNVVGEMNGELYLSARSSSSYDYSIWATDGVPTIDENSIFDANDTALINATKEGCKNNPASCGIYTVAPTLTKEMIASKGDGWHMIGTSTPVEDISLFNGVKSVWKWDGSSWLVYSPEPSIQSVLLDKNIKPLEKVNAFDGVWIQKK